MNQNKIFNDLISYLTKIENLVVYFLLSNILILSILQIISRNIFDSGFVWADNVLRVLVLWLGLAGAILASREKKHIKIDILSKRFSKKYQYNIKKIGLIFSGSICLMVSLYSFQFVLLEYKDSIYAFENIPAWMTEIIIPFSFLIMGIRFIVESFKIKNQT